jgi:hypothetical protein
VSRDIFGPKVQRTDSTQRLPTAVQWTRLQLSSYVYLRVSRRLPSATMPASSSSRPSRTRAKSPQDAPLLLPHPASPSSPALLSQAWLIWTVPALLDTSSSPIYPSATRANTAFPSLYMRSSRILRIWTPRTVTPWAPTRTLASMLMSPIVWK